MTRWQDLPWVVAGDDAAATAATEAADAFERILRLGRDAGPEIDESNDEVIAKWTVPGSPDHLTSIVVASRSLGSVHLVGLTGTDYRMASVECAIDTVREPRIRHSAIVDAVVAMLRAAARGPRATHTVRAMDEIEAVRTAIRLGTDWAETFEAVRRDRTPLGPCVLQVSAPSGLPHAVDEERTDAGFVKLKLTNGLVLLHPSHASRECDGFDAMETLRMHQTLSEEGR